MTPYTQHHTQSVHTGEQEPTGTAHHTSNRPPKRTQSTPPCRKETPCQTTKTNRPAKANPAGTKRVGRQGRPAKRDTGTRRRKREERNQPPPPKRAHSPLPRTGPRPGTNRACHGAKRARQREGVSPRLRNSTSGQGARATRRQSRAHAQHRTPARTTAQNTTPPRQTPTPDDERAAKIRMDVSAPGSEPSPCRLRTSRRPDGRVCARQGTQPLPATKQPPSGRTCVRPAVNPAPAGYEPAAVRMDVCAPGSEPSPCRLRNSRRPDGRVSPGGEPTPCRL